MSGKAPNKRMMTLADLNARDESQLQVAKSSVSAAGTRGQTIDRVASNSHSHRVSGSSSSKASNTFEDKREWKKIEQEEEAIGVFGDRNAKPRTSGLDNRAWEDIKQRKRSNAVFGDVY